ncbi:MAG: DUF47 domain-containing protein [Blastocatellia bacterium]
MFGLIPREERYFELFNQMAGQMTEAAKLLKTLFDDFANRATYADQIKKIEHTCDEITHDVIRRLNQTFITPIDREDIHALISELDDVVDYIEYAARRVILYRIEETSPHARNMSELIVGMVTELQKTVGMLGKNVAGIMDECVAIHDLENKGDSMHHQAVEDLFTNEKDPIRLLKWKEMYETLEKCIDKCEDASNVLEAIALKNT